VFLTGEDPQMSKLSNRIIASTLAAFGTAGAAKADEQVIAPTSKPGVASCEWQVTADVRKSGKENKTLVMALATCINTDNTVSKFAYAPEGTEIPAGYTQKGKTQKIHPNSDLAFTFSQTSLTISDTPVDSTGRYNGVHYISFTPNYAGVLGATATSAALKNKDTGDLKQAVLNGSFSCNPGGGTPNAEVVFSNIGTSALICR
jgi:hypothetical protein